MSQTIPSDGRPHFAVSSAVFGVFVTIGFPSLELYGESYLVTDALQVETP